MNKKHLLILGPQGSGKSHLLNIIKRLANPIQWVVLEAYTLPQKTKELRMNLAHGAFLIIEDVKSEAEMSMCLAFLDGFIGALAIDIEVIFTSQQDLVRYFPGKLELFEASYHLIPKYDH